MATHPGSGGAEFKRNRRLVLAGSDICWLCHHPGAWQVDHIRPRKYGGDDSVGNLAPAHGHDDRRGCSGIDYRCYYCSPFGVSCNQSRKAKPVVQAYRSRTW